jgi:hypothetical protein
MLGLSQFHAYPFLFGARNMFSDVIGLDRHFPVPAVVTRADQAPGSGWDAGALNRSTGKMTRRRDDFMIAKFIGGIPDRRKFCESRPTP